MPVRGLVSIFVKPQRQTRCIDVRIQRLCPRSGLALVVVKVSKRRDCAILFRCQTWAWETRRRDGTRGAYTVLGLRSRRSRRARIRSDCIAIAAAATADCGADHGAVGLRIDVAPQLCPFTCAQRVLVLRLVQGPAERAVASEDTARDASVGVVADEGGSFGRGRTCSSSSSASSRSAFP